MMVQLSVNQLVSETRKAALGKGMAFGMADDIARSVSWLAGYGIVPDDEIAAFLAHPLEALPKTPQKEGATISQDGVVSLSDVSAALDFMQAFSADTLKLSGLHYPALSLGLMALRQNRQWGSLIGQEGQALAKLASEAPSVLCVTLISYQSALAAPAPQRISVPSPVYDALKQAAHLTYVPSSEASRKAGAGAGLHDND